MTAGRSLLLVAALAAGCGARQANPQPPAEHAVAGQGSGSQPRGASAGGTGGVESKPAAMPAKNGPMSGSTAGTPGEEPPSAEAGTGGTAPVDVPTGSCAEWEQNLADRERHALQRLGLYRATGVVEAVLGAPLEHAGQSYARVTLGRVFHGWSFLQGVEVYVPMAPETHAEIGAGATVLLGLGASNQQPFVDSLMPELPIWTPLSAVITAPDRDAVKALAAYQPWKAENVGIAKIVSQDSARTGFEIVETIAGTLPSWLLVNTPVESKLPYPRVSDDEFIISVDWYDGPGGLATMPDIRPHTSANRADVEAALARWQDPLAEQAAYRAGLEAAGVQATETRTAFLYKRAELVASLQVRARALRCCAAANRFIIANEVVEVWQGTPPDAPLITFSDGAVLSDACGDRFIYALDAPIAAPPRGTEDFTCGDMPSPVDQPVRSNHYHRMPFSADNAAAVAKWLASEAPLYLLHPGDRAPSSELFAAPSSTNLWSSPLAPEAALAAGPLVLVKIERAIEHPDGHEVVLKTQLTPWPVDHLPDFEFKLFFRCGDPRWLQPGTTWLVPLARADVGSNAEYPALVAAGRLFFVPGLMLANREEYDQAAQALRTYPDASVAP